MDEEKRLEEDKYMRYRADPLMVRTRGYVPVHDIYISYYINIYKLESEHFQHM